MLDVFVETVVQLLMIYTIVARSVSSYRNDIENMSEGNNLRAAKRMGFLAV